VRRRCARLRRGHPSLGQRIERAARRGARRALRATDRSRAGASARRARAARRAPLRRSGRALRARMRAPRPPPARAPPAPPPRARVLANGRSPRERVRVNALLRETAPGAAAEEARRACGQGFATVKLKVGAEAPDRDRDRLVAVRAALGPAVQMRIDANGAWSADLAIAALRELDALELELAEQPVA